MRDILVIERDTDIRAFIIHSVGLLGHLVTGAENGRTGLAAFSASRFDLVICGLFVPHMDVRELLLTFRVSRPPVKLVLMSGGGLPTEVLEAEPPLFDAFLAKPFGPGELNACVVRLLNEQQRGPAD